MMNANTQHSQQFRFLLHGIVILLVFSAITSFAQVQTDVPALKNVFAKDFTIGCLLSYPHVGFPTDPPVSGQSSVVDANGGYLIKHHMNSMSPGNNMKPQYTVNLSGSVSAYNAATTQAAKDSINVNPLVGFNGNLIAQLNWAKRQGFTFRGHTLVWHSQTPGTGFFRTGYSSTAAYLSKELMTQRMENYIKEVIRLLHEGWPGLLSAMDVVNEAVNDGSGTDRTTGNEWYTVFGDMSYIMKAFEYTRKYTVQYGESQIKLYYNDYNTHDAAKANGIVRLCTPIYQSGFLDGIGMQEHDALTSPTAEQWIASYNKFYPVCSEMAVTELDVTTGSASPSSSVLTQQANQYGQLFKCFVERSYKSGRGKIINVSKDGLNDQYTFKTNQSSSLWTTQSQCKPAFYDVVSIGQNYNTLDSMLTSIKTLRSTDYSAAAWANLTAAAASAQQAMTQNYSVSLSAASALSKARDSLKTAVDGLTTGATGITLKNPDAPAAFSLSQNFPNPFNPTTQIRYSLSEPGLVTLKVYDLLGTEVASLVNGTFPAGSHTATFNAGALPSGVYLYQLSVVPGGPAKSFKETKRLILLK